MGGDYGALAIDSKTGVASASGDVSALNSLAAFGRTMLAAVGVAAGSREDERAQAVVRETMGWSKADVFAVLLEPAAVVAKALDHISRIGRRAAWRPATVLVTGAGPIGLLAALLGR